MECIVRGRLIGQHVGYDIAADKFGQHVSSVADERD
jgi:hypothetical protein